jgi:UDP-N-acetyl-D-galactosamine dehydrogenase
MARPVGDYLAKLAPGGLFVDVKCQMAPEALRTRGIRVWRL